MITEDTIYNVKLKGKKPECIESLTQYDKPESKITKSYLSIIF